jgi:hypothetical protein
MGAADEVSRDRLVWIRALFAFAALAGLLMIALSFANWVDFEPETDTQEDGPNFSFSLDGTDLSRVRGPDYEQPADILGQTEYPCSCRVGFGDGYLLMGLGGVIAAAAVVGAAVRLAMRPAAGSIVIASLLAFAIAGYNATGLWEGVGARTLEDTFVNLDGDVRLELVVLTAIAALPAVLASAVWSIFPRTQDGGIDEAPTEDAEVWT